MRHAPWRRTAGLLLAGVLAVASLAACGGSSTSASTSAPIKIGFANPLTGSEASYGQSDLHAIQLAASQINAKGGVNGQKIQVVQYDTKADPATGVAGAHFFVTQKVAAVVGFFNSDISIPASKILHQAGIPMVSAASTNPKLTQEGYHNVFRVCGTDNQQGKVEADYAYNILHAKTAVVLNDEEVYGQGVSQYFSQEFTKLGGKILDSEGISAKQSDFSAIVTKIKNLKPALVQFGGFYQAAGLLVKQMREQGVTAAFMSDDGTIGPSFTKIGGQQSANAYLSSSPSPQDLATAKTFVAQFVKKYGNQPTEFATYTYDALMVLANAIKQAGSASPAKITSALAATKGFQGTTGPITFDSVGNNTTPSYVIYKVQSDLSYKMVWNPNSH